MYRNSPSFTRREIVFTLAVSVLVVLLANLPVLLGYLQSDQEHVYTGATVGAMDYYSYLAKINQGQAGSWLYQLPFSSQAHTGAPIFLYYLFLGHLSGWLGIGTTLIFHIAQVINALILLFVLYYFIAFWTERASERRFLFLFTVLSSGIGWLVMLGGRFTSTDLSVPESNVFFSLMSTAHFSLSQALMLIFFILLLVAPPAQNWRRAGQAILLMASAALLMILQPFMAAVILPVGGLFLLAQWRISRLFPQPTFWRMLLATVVCFGLAIWTYLAVQADPFLANWQAQNQTLSPPFWDYLSGYGLVFLAGLAGMVWAIRQKDAALWMLVAWVLVTVVGLYSPTLLQRRLSLGLHIPLAILGGLAVLNVWLLRRKEKKRQLNAYAFLAVTTITSLLLILINVTGVISRDPKVNLTRNEAAALHYLDNHSQTGEIALASDEFNSFIPAFTHLRAVSGHEFETVDYEQTVQLVNKFFSGQMDDVQMDQLLTSWHVNYMIFGTRESTTGVSAPQFRINFDLLQTIGNVKIYKRNN